jgi:tight adherence protein B
MIEKIVFAVFAAALLSTTAVYLILREKLGIRNKRVRRRLNELATEHDVDEDVVYPILRDYKLSTIPTLDRILSRFRFSQNLQQLIDQAGIPMKAGALVLAMLSLGGLVFIVVRHLSNFVILSLVAAFFVGSLPYYYVRWKKGKRKEEFESFLPEAIDLMANALKSGFSLESALSMVAREIPDPVGIEFGIAFEEQNIGVPLHEALSNMARRVESNELSLMTTALVIHKKTGGNLAEILERIGNTIRQRFRLEREIKIHSAHGRLSALILILLPIILALAIFVIRPDYVKVLWVEKIGRYLLGAAVIMQLIGIWIIRRIANVQV